MKVEPIRIERVHTIVEPRIKETPCACGGMLRYGPFSFSAAWNGQRLEIGDVRGYKCDQDGCSVTLFPEPIGREIEWHISRIRGTLSTKQKLEGLLKGYSSKHES